MAIKNQKETVSQDVDQLVAGWEKEQIGFPPYWNPVVGAKILCKPVMCDARDPEFPRYVMQATRMPIECAQGPSEEREPVIVQPGDYFTMSVYGALPPETMQLYMGIEIMIHCKSQRKLSPTDESRGVPRKLFVFEIMVHPSAKKLIGERKEALEKQLAVKNAETPDF